MKFGLIIGFAVSIIFLLAGCGSSVATQSVNSPSIISEPTQSVSSPTPEITNTNTTTRSVTWENGIREIFELQCSECHSSSPTGGFSVTSYTKVLQGSTFGAIIIPGNPDESHLFYKMKFGGNHPGYFSKDQTDMVWEWVSNGAPE